MRSVQVVARGRAEFVQVEKPEVRPGHVLVRASHLSLCGSDIQMLHYAPDESYPFPPGTTGHEMVGVVVAAGEGADAYHPGDRVLAMAPGHQAMCEYYSALREHVVPLPDGKPFEVLLQAQQLGTVLYACQRLPNVVGKNVAVIGQGSAGLWFNFQLRRMGALNVAAFDIDSRRLVRSTAFGATHIVDNSVADPREALQEIFSGELADVVVEAAGEVASINLAISLVKKYGDLLYFGYPRAQEFVFHFDELFHKCCRATTIVGASVESNQTSTRLAVALIAEGEAKAEGLITHRVAFDDVIDAYEMHRTRADGCVKIVIEMSGASG